ncbi:hypothetical protein PMSD_17240 [Paenibacillus macquariensis subsp. defensor]|nr:hypothetical protein PMSD_17240 [Paenibacillus macquariensis subsp. defensor]
MKKGTILLILVLLFSIVGCNDVADLESTKSDTKKELEEKYLEFRDQFLIFKKQFNPSTDFTLISPSVLNVATATFPENSIEKKETDFLSTDVGVPVRYELYYKSNFSEMIVKLNIMYLENIDDIKEDSSFISINTITRDRNENLESEYKNLDRPMLEEYYLTYKNKLIVINFLEQVNYKSKNQYEKKYDSFVQEQLKFYHEFEKSLKENFK